MRALIIVGLPGSGKSTLAKTLSRYYGYEFFDDPSSKDTDTMERLKTAIANKKYLIITDPYLCYKGVQDQLTKMLSEYNNVQWLYYECDVDQCLKNASKREDKKVDGLIKHLSKHYHIPVGTITKKVYGR